MMFQIVYQMLEVKYFQESVGHWMH